MYVRNFVQSKAVDGFAAKLAPKFIKGVVMRKVGGVAYQISDPHGKELGVYHAKDIRS